MDDRRKQLKAQYKNRQLEGGVYRILNKINGSFYLNKTNDIQSSHNWFLSCYSTGICTHPYLVTDWNKYGKDAFVFEVLEIWEKDATQTEDEFKNDLDELFKIWNDKLPQEGRY